MKIQTSLLTPLMSTGIDGHDDILVGGLTPEWVYLVKGETSAGKIATGLQFVVGGVRRGESVVLINLVDTHDEIQGAADSHDLSQEYVHIPAVLPSESVLQPEAQDTMFHPSEVEIGTTRRKMLSVMDERNPARMVIDSLSALQSISDKVLRHRREAWVLETFFGSRAGTGLLLDDRAAGNGDLQVGSLAQGVITRKQTVKNYESERRRLRVMQCRGRAFRSGMHDGNLQHGALRMFPRLEAAESHVIGGITQRDQRQSGTQALNHLRGGGLDEGTGTLTAGPLGTGKLSLSAPCVAASVRGQPSVMFLFEEATGTLLNRADGLGMSVYEGEPAAIVDGGDGGHAPRFSHGGH